MVKKVVEVGILFDFYGKLLSKSQFDAIDLYYAHDLSLAEIGKELNVSRQSVYDTLKRAEENLYQYEELLALVEKFYINRKNIEEIQLVLKDLREGLRNLNDKFLENKLKKLEKIIAETIHINQEVVD